MPVANEDERRTGKRPWVWVVPTAILSLLLMVAVVVPMLGWQGTVGGVLVTAGTANSGYPQGITIDEVPGLPRPGSDIVPMSRMVNVRLGELQWQLWGPRGDESQ